MGLADVGDLEGMRVQWGTGLKGVGLVGVKVQCGVSV